jgi:predicted NBD/HSP70 family sugar kinase
MVASLFRMVPDADFKRVVKDIYPHAAKEIGDVPLVVANDGDVTALAGAMNLNDTQVLGIAMGTSLAAGYINKDGDITGRLNELAFAPVDGKDAGAVDEWSGDKGCGVKYMSQDAVALLANVAGIELAVDATPAEKLQFIQNLPLSQTTGIFKSIGCYLGHALALYREIYDCRHVLLLGRVMSGAGGNLIKDTAELVLHDDYPEVKDLTLHLPDENARRVGQSVAAAALPKLKQLIPAT